MSLVSHKYRCLLDLFVSEKSLVDVFHLLRVAEIYSAEFNAEIIAQTDSNYDSILIGQSDSYSNFPIVICFLKRLPSDLSPLQHFNDYS